MKFLTSTILMLLSVHSFANQTSNIDTQKLIKEYPFNNYKARHESGSSLDTYKSFSVLRPKEFSECNDNFVKTNLEKLKNSDGKVEINFDSLVGRTFMFCGLEDALPLYDERNFQNNELKPCFMLRSNYSGEESNFVHYLVIEETTEKLKIKDCVDNIHVVNRNGLGTPTIIKSKDKILPFDFIYSEGTLSGSQKDEYKKNKSLELYLSPDWCEANDSQKYLIKGDIDLDLKFESKRYLYHVETSYGECSGC